MKQESEAKRALNPHQLSAIEKVVRMLARSFAFAYYDVDDIAQQARLYAIELLRSGKYDSSRPLENFLYTHVRNRLINLRRDKLLRNEPPCASCASGTPCGPHGNECKRYRDWNRRVQDKLNIMFPSEVTTEAPEASAKSVEDQVAQRELLTYVRDRLPIHLQEALLKALAGAKLSAAKRSQLESAIRRILENEQ